MKKLSIMLLNVEKRHMKNIIPLFSLMFILLLAGTKAFSQEIDTIQSAPINDAIEQQMENIIERLDSKVDLSEFVTDIEYLKYNPINLNAKDESELRRLPLLNEQQIKNLQEYKKNYGDITSLFELITIEGFNDDFIMLISPYVMLSEYVPEKFNLKRAFKYGKTNILMRYQRVLQERKGYQQFNDSTFALNPNRYYLGSPDALLIRAQYNYKNYLRFGFVAEKDAGEPLFHKYDTLKKGFDFYSFHFMLKDIGFVKQLAIGDYRVQLGQGLVMWNGFTMGKMNGSLVSRRYGDPIKPHSSSNEYTFMRGAATTLGFGNFEFTVFYGNTPKDAGIITSDSLSDIEQRISSIQETGYHRTLGEINKKNSVKEQAIGGRVTYRFNSVNIGASALNLSYNTPFVENTALYKKFYPSLENNTYFGVDYSTIYKKLTLYGEFAYQLDAGTAFLQGASFSPDPKISLSAVFRNYQKNYFNPKSNAFGENSKNTNESGLYIGVITTPLNKVTISAYADMFEYKWLKYRVDAPSKGSEYATQLTYEFSRRGEIIGSYRKRINPQNFISSEFKLNKIGTISRDYYRVQFNYQLLPWLKVQNRFEFIKRNSITKGKEVGHLIYQGVQIQPVNKNWRLYMRYVLFDTDSYDTRLYTYENDVPYSFSIPAFYGNGSRFYAMFRTDLNRNVTIMLRYAVTHYNDRQVISSGLSEIQGNNKSDFKAVLRLKF
jgi:hypothetical protein